MEVKTRLKETEEVIESLGFLPITALQYVHFNDRGLLLVGTGPWLRIISSLDGTLLIQVKAIPTKRIHGICIIETTEHLNVLVFGQKSFRWVSFNDDFTLNGLSDIYEMKDWILDVCCISFKTLQCFIVAVGLAHNTVAIFDASCNKLTVIASEVYCLLYSIHVVLVNDKLMIASGTVFGDILVWCKEITHEHPACSSLCKPAVILKGHEGVIFGVQFNKDQSRLATVSDDRSIRLWNLPSNWENEKGFICSCCSVIVYGHTSRIWNIMWTSSNLISIGEDATCRVWNHDGNCTDVIQGHKGCNIWSVSIDQLNSIVFTGGADCGIIAYNLKANDKVAESTFATVLDRKEITSPKKLVLWKDEFIFVISDNGSLYAMNLNNSHLEWSKCHDDLTYSNYGILSASETLPLLAIGNLMGKVKILLLPAANEACYEWQCHDGKIFSLIWLNEKNDTHTQLLLSCGPNGIIICWFVSYENHILTVSPFLNLILPPSKHRWVTSCITQRNDDNELVLICGDRSGSVHVYCCPFTGSQKETYRACQSFYRIHGPNGVTHLTFWNNSLYSVGRDGYCRRISCNKNSCDVNSFLKEIYKFHPVNGMVWIQEISFTERFGLLTSGFHGNEFILNSSKVGRSIFKRVCGGGHRSCVLSSPSKVTARLIIMTGKVTLAYIKGSDVFVIQEDISNQLYCPVLQESFMGHNAVSVCLLSQMKDHGPTLFAVGSEDCFIALVTVDNAFSLRKIGSLEGHTSVVHSLSCVNSMKDDAVLLFSGGGRASLKAWLVYTDKEDSYGSLQCEYNLHNLPFKPQRRKSHCPPPPPECRVTALDSFYFNSSKLSSAVSSLSRDNLVCVVAGCSDGIIRIYLYDQLLKSFTLIENTSYHSHCILSVSCTVLSFTDNEIILLISGATDGQLVFWNISLLLEQWFSAQSSDKFTLPNTSQSLNPLISINAHQSGINDVAVNIIEHSSNENILLIVSIGDDTALTLTQCSVSFDGQLAIIAQNKVPNAHYSPGIGVSFLPTNNNFIVTTSTDQRLSLWCIINDTLTLTKEKEYIHNVIDPSCLLSFEVKDTCCTVVCGVGMECLASL